MEGSSARFCYRSRLQASRSSDTGEKCEGNRVTGEYLEKRAKGQGGSSARSNDVDRNVTGSPPQASPCPRTPPSRARSAHPRPLIMRTRAPSEVYSGNTPGPRDRVEAHRRLRGSATAPSPIRHPADGRDRGTWGNRNRRVRPRAPVGRQKSIGVQAARS